MKGEKKKEEERKMREKEGEAWRKERNDGHEDEGRKECREGYKAGRIMKGRSWREGEKKREVRGEGVKG